VYSALRPAAVNDRDARALVNEHAQVGGEQLRLTRADDLAADLDDEGHGQFPASSRLACSAHPSMRFMFWIA
jgi:hypothetical protein